jgi:1-pyrroline-5-carboxylate dehydrogenase
VPVPGPSDFPLENEPVLSYEKGSPERAELEKVLDKMSNECEEVPLVIGNEEIRTDLCKHQVMVRIVLGLSNRQRAIDLAFVNTLFVGCLQPHDHKRKIARYYWATPDLVKKAIGVAVKAQREWEKWPIEARLEMWLRIGDLMATKYRQHLNAATMLGQSKTVIQAEIDSAAELIDFFKMHAYFVKESLKYQPISPNRQTLNSMRYRGMDGFVAAVSPFNFTAIGGNLSYTPALMVRNVPMDRARSSKNDYDCRVTPCSGSRPTPRSCPIGGSSRSAERPAYRPAWSTLFRARDRCLATISRPHRISSASTLPARCRRSTGCGRRSAGMSPNIETIRN